MTSLMKRENLSGTANKLASKILHASQQDAINESNVGRWYFVTPNQWKALAKDNLGIVDQAFGYDLLITNDPEKTGRQLDAYELVSVIDTYPSYPRAIPR